MLAAGADTKNVKGVTDVVEVPEGVAVVATSTWAALQGRRALKVQWDESASKDLDSEALLARYRAQAAQPGTPFAKLDRFVARPPKVWWPDYDTNVQSGLVGWQVRIQTTTAPDSGQTLSPGAIPGKRFPAPGH